jgi:maltose alpha-D-glucosyltransferase/alpha-amylase
MAEAALAQTTTKSKTSRRNTRFSDLGTDPLWYKDAVIYEAHVRAFHDSNGDGIGDFRGLTEKLDYLQELGITAIWLLPFYPSPLKDDGYDIADYYSINPIYGTLKDFKVFLQEAHRRHLRVITELVVNHTSDQHPWFQRSRRAKAGTAWRDFYVWNDTPDKYRDARIIFRDFEPSNWTWDPVAKSYFWHRFYSHQPDLNYDNPQVAREIIRVLDFWLDMGVDGLRLDAVPYLYERENTSCENLSQTHDYLKTLRRHVDEKYGDRMLLAEANQWPEDAVSYFGSGKGDECHMAFHFPLMPRIFMAVRMEDRVPIVDILQQTPPIPETSQWALFLRNHDELTLEMVTDEERDYMYRVYATQTKARINLGIRRRLAPLLGNDRKRIELLKMLLLSFPGAPVLYYGDEIGMGDNVFLGDRNGVRTPMQWSSDKNAGFSRASPQALYLPIILDPEYHYEAVNVEAQQGNRHSLLWWMRRVLALRKRHRAFGRGTIQFLQPENRKILAFVRRYESETILVVANLSRFPQPVELDLSEFKQTVPQELFGRTQFPRITEKPYFLTLSPHAMFWFSLEPVAGRAMPSLPGGSAEPLAVPQDWEEILIEQRRAPLESRLFDYLQNQSWFGGKARQLKSVQIRDTIKLPVDSSKVFLLFLLAEYVEGDPEEYFVPLGFATGKDRENLQQRAPGSIMTGLRLEGQSIEGVLYDAVDSDRFCRSLVAAIGRRRSYINGEGELKALATSAWRTFGANQTVSDDSISKVQQSNTALVIGHKYFLKVLRRMEPGPNPDLELGRFLTERDFPAIAPVAGALKYMRANGEEFTVAILTRFLPGAKNAWEYTLDALGRYFERIGTAVGQPKFAVPAGGPPIGFNQEPVPESVAVLIGTYLEAARLLGQRTGQLHVALASEPDDKDFAPEPFTPFYQRSLFQSMRNLTVHTLLSLRRSIDRVPEAIRPEAEKVIALESAIVKQFKAVHERGIACKRIRCHGNLHLGEILYTGKDFVFIDFEGESARPLGERRIKRSPLNDVAAMLRSFEFTTYAALFNQLDLGTLHEERLPQLEPWTGFWYRWVSSVYLNAYLEVVGKTDLLPRSKEELKVLFDAHLLEKAVYEIGYELKHRPSWLKIPFRAIAKLVEAKPASSPSTSPSIH